MSGKINKELTMNPDKTGVTLFMKENASQDWVTCCPLQVQAFFQQHNAKHQGLCQTNPKDRRQRSVSIAIISKSLTPFLTKKKTTLVIEILPPLSQQPTNSVLEMIQQ